MKRTTLALFVGASLLFGGATDSMSQQFTGSIRGAVRDAQGIIPGVTVTLTNEGTTVARDTITNEVGEYAFVAVPPSAYSIRTSLPGYKTYEQRGLNIGTAQAITLDLILEVGTVEEEITVTADAPLIETSNASLGDSLDREILEMLPAPGRNAYLIAVTIPTMIPVGDPQFNRQQDQSNASRVSLGGGGIRANNYLLDGVQITELTGRAVVNATIESLSDVKVQIHTYDAEMGRTGGGVFNATAKSGTNEFHGTGFFQTRPIWGQNVNYFAAERGESKADVGLDEQYYRLYGGGAGGALWQNRTFFWAATEGYRSQTSRELSELWPSANQKVGDFSTSTLDGSPVVLFNPWCRDGVTNARCPATGTGSLASGGLFTGAVIPSDHPAASTVGFNAAGRWPLPLDSNEDGTDNVTTSARDLIDEADLISLKIEHKFTDNVSLSGFYIYNNTDEPGSIAMPDGFNFLDTSTGILHRRPHVLVFNNTNIINDTTVLTLRYGWTTWQDGSTQRCADFEDGCFEDGLASLGFSQNFLNSVDASAAGLFPELAFDDAYDAVGESLGSAPRRWGSPYAINAAFTKLAGAHTIKIGGDIRRLGVKAAIDDDTAGTYEFEQDFTSLNGVGGHEFASLLLGLPSGGEIPFDRGAFNVYTRYYSGYIQDDWRVASNFTLNFGIRMEHEQGLREVDNRFTVGFDETVVNPLDGLVSAAARAGTPLEGRQLLGGLLFAGVGGNNDYQGNLPAAKFSPRVGATFSINDSTVVRGGYGLFYAPWNYDSTTHGQIGFNRLNALQQSSDESEVPITTLSDPFPDGLQSPTGSSLGLLTGVGGGISFINQNKGAPKVHQYSFDLQRQLPYDMAITIGYAGATGRDLGFGGERTSQININQIPPEVALAAFPGAGGGWDPTQLRESIPNPFFGITEAGEFAGRATIQRGQLMRPFPAFGNLDQFETTEGGRRQYNALIVKLDKRTASGFGGRFSYTFSSTQDNTFGQTSNFGLRTNGAQNNYDLDNEYSSAIHNSPHRLILAPIFRLPSPGEDRPMANALFGGWTMSGIFEFVSGTGFSARNSGGKSESNLGLFGGRQRGDGPTKNPATTGGTLDRIASAGQSGVRYFDRTAFDDPGPGRYGNSARIIDDARYQFRKNIDFVVAKNTEIGGGTIAQVRFEILNLTNTPKFGRVDSDSINSSVFGRVDGLQGFMRIWQISFRLTY